MLHVRLTDETLRRIEIEAEKKEIGASTLARIILLEWLTMSQEQRDGPRPKRPP